MSLERVYRLGVGPACDVHGMLRASYITLRAPCTSRDAAADP